MSDYIIVMATASSIEEGERIARAVVGEELAACCNIFPEIRSVYRWKGDICDEREVMLIMKSRATLFTALQERIRELHSYEVPEIISFTVESGLEEYLAWIGSVTKG
ncbi:MAG: divalent-cation tolerance protein CutA [Thermodesulfobacteriota bacterium]